jgi:tagaturonate reductase
VAKLSRQLFDRPLRPIRILQFGEGNFLRAFVDNFIQILNDQQLIDSNIVVVQPVPVGRVRDMEAQDGLYTLFLEGMQDGKIIKSHQVIDVLSEFIDPYTQLDLFLAQAQNPDLQVIFSNTTEAGIVFVPETIQMDKTPTSFPGKLLQFLIARFEHFNGNDRKGLDIVACELIDDNGDQLKAALFELAKYNHLPHEFIDWALRHNRFYNTLVDRIVPGYPKDNAAELQAMLGYEDNSMVKGEIFHLWVIEGPAHLKSILPFDQSGLEVFYVESIKPYKQRKVKILNGSHTAMVPIAYLMGKTAVKESIEEESIRSFVSGFVAHEVVPTIALPEADMKAFAASVFERYQNPFIHHLLLSISLNSVSKFKSRILPTIQDNLTKGKFPRHALFSLAALIVFYRGIGPNGSVIPLSDEARFLDLFKQLWSKNDPRQVASAILADSFWETGTLSRKDIESYVSDQVALIVEHGMANALHHFLKG